ncbi:hypothetical protein T484DRAFT_1879611 [Baffinella frigidus]|nr:hypothetical protein T484DRAFT_1879611 [Cryptophyta sp. CCMP2293]
MVELGEHGMAGGEGEGAQGDSTSEEVARLAEMLAGDDLDLSIEVADDLVGLVGREPRPDKTVLEELLTHPRSLQGITKILQRGDDDARQTACNLLFLLSMSEPERPFDKSCTAQVKNRTSIGNCAEVLSAVLYAIDSDTPAVVNAALNALMSVSFDNSPACLAIAKTPRLIRSFLLLLEERDGVDEARDGVMGRVYRAHPLRPPFLW